jgi:hypothetical protein
LKKYNKLESGHPITVEKFRQLYDSDEAMTRNEIKTCLKNNNISYRSKANEDVDYDLNMFNDGDEVNAMPPKMLNDARDSETANMNNEVMTGRRKGKSLKNRSNCKDKRKYFPKTKMSCKKRRMTWNRKSKRCNIKNM